MEEIKRIIFVDPRFGLRVLHLSQVTKSGCNMLLVLTRLKLL